MFYEEIVANLGPNPRERRKRQETFNRMEQSGP